MFKNVSPSPGSAPVLAFDPRQAAAAAGSTAPFPNFTAVTRATAVPIWPHSLTTVPVIVGGLRMTAPTTFQTIRRPSQPVPRSRRRSLRPCPRAIVGQGVRWIGSACVLAGPR